MMSLSIRISNAVDFSEVRPGDIRRRRQLEIRPIRAVLPACDDDTFYAHIDASAYCGDGSSGARGSIFDQSVRKSSRFNQSEPSSRHATTKTATTTHATRGDNSILEIILHSVERNENASASSGDTDTSDNFRSCNPGVFNSGATYRLGLQCYHLAGKSERKKKQQQPQQQQQGIINVVQCKGGHPFVDPTEGPTRPLVYMKGKIPSEYYLLRSETLQDIAMNAMFNNYGCGHDDLPPPLQRMYHNHIYI